MPNFEHSKTLDRGVTHARLFVDTQSDDDDDGLANTIEVLLGPMSRGSGHF